MEDRQEDYGDYKENFRLISVIFNVILHDMPENTFISIPLDPANTDYQAIQEWVAKGNKIEDAD